MQVSIARLPYRLEESFRYDAVNGTDSLAGIPSIVVPPVEPLTLYVTRSGGIRSRRPSARDATP